MQEKLRQTVILRCLYRAAICLSPETCQGCHPERSEGSPLDIYGDPQLPYGWATHRKFLSRSHAACGTIEDENGAPAAGWLLWPTAQRGLPPRPAAPRQGHFRVRAPDYRREYSARRIPPTVRGDPFVTLRASSSLLLRFAQDLGSEPALSETKGRHNADFDAALAMNLAAWHHRAVNEMGQRCSVRQNAKHPGSWPR